MGRKARPKKGPEPGRSTPSRQMAYPWREALFAALAALLVYVNGIPGDFVFDDKLIQRDARIHDLDVGSIFTTDYWGGYAGTTGDLYRPLTVLSYALNYAVSGATSAAFHAVNIALHGAVCALAVLLLGRLLADRRLALVAGLLFATHPVHTEAVTGIVGRAELLTALFLLVPLLACGGRRDLSRLPPPGVLAASLLSYLGALLCKETAITGLGLLVLVEAIRRAELPRWQRERALVPGVEIVTLHVAVALVYLGIRYAVLGTVVTQPPARIGLLFGEPLGIRLATGLQTLAINMRLLVWPVSLSADYSYRQVPVVGQLTGTVVAGLLVAAGLVYAFVWAIRRQRMPLVFALGLFAVTYSVVSNLLLPIGVLVAERLLYLPSLGFCCAVAWLWWEAAKRGEAAFGSRRARSAAVALLAVVVSLYGARTMFRNLDWRNAETLYAAAAAASPECQAAHYNYAAVLMVREERWADELALKHLLRSREIHADDAKAAINLANVYLRLGRPEDARQVALEGLGTWPKNRNLRTLLNVAEGRLRDPARPDG